MMALLISPFLVSFVAAKCKPAPIKLPITNVTVSGAGGGFNRGVQLAIGNPPQSFAFDVYFDYNNTYLWNESTICSDTGRNACASQHGGFHSVSASHGWPGSNVTEIGGASHDFAPVSDTSLLAWFNDDFHFNLNISVPDVPFAARDTDWPGDRHSPFPLAILGLSSNSTLLNSLGVAGAISSQVWSYYYGLTGATQENQRDGSLVLGGFDASLVAGQPHMNVSIGGENKCDSPGIPSVGISDINVVLPNGTKASLFGGVRSSALDACLDPSDPTLLNMPYSMYLNFEQLTGQWTKDRSFGVDFYDMLGDNTSDTIFKGDLEISLLNGFSVTVPNDQLIQPTWQIDNVTGKLFENLTAPTLLINSLQDTNSDDIAILGRNFLSVVYMMVSTKQQQMTLWPIRPDAQRGASGSQLLAVDDQGNFASTTCSTSAVNGTRTGDGLTSVGKHLSAGGIAGIVIGSVIGGTLLMALLFRLVKRQRRLASQRRQTSTLPPLIRIVRTPEDAKCAPPSEATSSYAASGNLASTSHSSSRVYSHPYDTYWPSTMPVENHIGPEPVELPTTRD